MVSLSSLSLLSLFLLFCILVLTAGVSSMFIPVDDDATGWDQSVWRIEKDEEGNVTRKKLFGVRYVPLTDPPKR
jgi:hypothetical protein